MDTNVQATYRAAVAADAAYQDALVSLYGARAGDMRYASTQSDSLRAVRARKLACDVAMHAAVRIMRAAQS